MRGCRGLCPSSSGWGHSPVTAARTSRCSLLKHRVGVSVSKQTHLQHVCTPCCLGSSPKHVPSHGTWQAEAVWQSHAELGCSSWFYKCPTLTMAWDRLGWWLCWERRDGRGRFITYPLCQVKGWDSYLWGVVSRDSKRRSHHPV